MQDDATGVGNLPDPSPAWADDAKATEFPGCRPFRLPREMLKTYEGRVEYWDGETETAWEVCAAPSATHELPATRLMALATAIAQEAGIAVEGFGTLALVERDARGRSLAGAQADQVIYVRPERAYLPEDTLTIGVHDFPDVLFEVDFTTDVTVGKLDRYQDWGFPEVWVEVPDRISPNRRPGMRPGLAIHVLDSSGHYASSAASQTFPGWTAAEIHRALNEPQTSLPTMQVLRRVGRRLDEVGGTGPDDALWLRLHRDEARAQGRLGLLAHLIGEPLGADALAGLRLRPADLIGVSDEDVLEALRDCDGAADFQVRLSRYRAMAGQ